MLGHTIHITFNIAFGPDGNLLIESDQETDSEESEGPVASYNVGCMTQPYQEEIYDDEAASKRA